MEDARASASLDDLWHRFAARASAVGAEVRHVRSFEAAAEVVEGVAASPARTASLAGGFPAAADRWPPVAGWEPAPSDVVARGAFAVAETGSVLLDEANVDRGACLLAERLWLLVPADQIVPNLDVAFGRLGQSIGAGARHAIFVTGPSRSADIERIVAVGVHGPREVRVLVVGGTA